MKKFTGKRIRPTVYPPAETRYRRAAQSARAILAGRGEREKHWERIARCFADLQSADAACLLAHRLGLDTVPAHLLDAAFPPPPPEVEDVGTLVSDPIFGEVLEVELEPIAAEPAA